MPRPYLTKPTHSQRGEQTTTPSSSSAVVLGHSGDIHEVSQPKNILSRLGKRERKVTADAGVLARMAHESATDDVIARHNALAHDVSSDSLTAKENNDADGPDAPDSKKRRLERLEKDKKRAEQLQHSLDTEGATRELRQAVEKLQEMKDSVSRLAIKRNESLAKAIEVLHSDDAVQSVDVLRMNVGGELFTVPFDTLLKREPESFFTALLTEGQVADYSSSNSSTTTNVMEVNRDASGAVFIDRDPEIFRYILLYLRGYTYFHTLDEEKLHRLRVDARYYNLRHLLQVLNEPELLSDIKFKAGPGVSPDHTRLRVVYGVAVVGDTFLVTGRHRITFQVLSAEYVGVGLISDACFSCDQECHRTPNCCVYYMSGVFYTNYPHHRKEENLERFETNDYVSILVDMDKGYAEFILKNSTRLISLGRTRRLKFATTMKLSSRVRIVPDHEAAALPMLQNLTDLQSGTPLFSTAQLNAPCVATGSV